MEYLVWICLVIAVVQLMVSLVNLVYRQQFPLYRRTESPLVSVLIPARNEELNMAALLKGLQGQDYGPIEIIVFNDNSTDKTDEIVAGFAVTDKRIKLIGSDYLPEGWLGKNYACHSLSKHANGDFFLFLDADVRLAGSIIRDAVNMSSRENLGLLSIFPRQVMLTAGEWMTVPNMNFILLSLLPLVLVRKSRFASLSAANGQFMLFNASCYKKLLPHEIMRAKKVEDIEIARYFKKKKIKVACLAGNEQVSCRMYQGFGEAVTGFSKNVIHFFGNSFLIAIFYWLVTAGGFFLVLLTAEFQVRVVYLVTVVLGRMILSFISRQNILYNLIFFLPQQVALGLMIFRAFIHKRKKNYLWKGRIVS
jgi:glycosyltransferase involved in cell wall biosynthesis